MSVSSVAALLAAAVAGPAAGHGTSFTDGPKGYRDVNFASAGIARLPVMRGSRAVDLEQGPDGSLTILVDEHRPEGGHRALLWRLNAEGSVDASYGVGGVASPVVRESFRPAALVPTGEGAYLVAGDVVRGTNVTPGVARVLADGQVDESFGRQGLVSATIAGEYRVEDAVASLGGLVLVGGSARGRPMLGRLVGGRLILVPLDGRDGPTRLRAVAATGTGAYITTGVTDVPEVGLAYPLWEFRLGSDAAPLTIVPTFGGTMTDPKEHCQFNMADVVMQGAMNVTVGIAHLCDGVPDSFGAVVARQLPDGVADDPFGAPRGMSGEGAVMKYPGPGFWWSARAAAVDSQGRIIVVGTAYATSAGAAIAHDVTTPRPLSFRLRPDGTEDPTFALNALALRNSAWSWYGEDVIVTSSDDVVVLGTARSADSTHIRVVKLNG